MNGVSFIKYLVQILEVPPPPHTHTQKLLATGLNTLRVDAQILKSATKNCRFKSIWMRVQGLSLNLPGFELGRGRTLVSFNLKSLIHHGLTVL